MSGERLPILKRLAEIRRRRAIARVGRSAHEYSVAERVAREALAGAAAAERARAEPRVVQVGGAASGATISRASRARALESWERAERAARGASIAATARRRLERARADLCAAERDCDAQRSFADRASRRAAAAARRRADRFEADAALDTWTAARVDDAR
jgi:hypothetical protein